jgi:uncharacterized membrane protein
MSKFVVVVFPSEEKASEGSRALQELHEEGSVSVVGAAVLVKDADGRVSVKEPDGPGPRGALLGALLVGLIGGPAVAALGAAGGALAGGWRDVLNLGVATDFVDEVSRELTPGRSAVVAEVIEDWVTPLDTRMDAIGGIVLREQRIDIEDEVIRKEAEARATELAQLKAERAAADEGAKARLDAPIEAARAKLERTSRRAKAQTDRVREEADTRIATCRDQAAEAKPDTKARIEQRIAELRADRDRRVARLKHAWDLTKEALEP